MAAFLLLTTHHMRFFALTIFVSAFLLFQIQPLIGKYILPWFGSATGVWITALLFFQFVLLAGYSYAHLIASKLSSRHQAYVHLALLVGALLLLPITPSEAWKPEAGDNPTWRILLLLTVSVGGPYLLLSATSPLLQNWFARLNPGVSPYRLYAVSNAGSLLALLTYPFVFERFIRLQTQTWWWSGSFVVFAILAGVCVWWLMKGAPGKQAKAAPKKTPDDATQSATQAEAASPGLSRIFLWLALAMSGSIMLLATMNRMNQDVPPVPFLFILPLSLYLTTFIIAFDHERWYYRPVFCVLLLLAIMGVVVVLYAELELGLIAQIVLFSLALFACCMSCHGELVRLKPDPQHLTLFYLIVSLGGTLGGLFVAVLAPSLFDGYWEYEIGLAASYGLVMFLVGRDLWRWHPSAAVEASESTPQKAVGKQRPKSGKRKGKPARRKGDARKGALPKNKAPKARVRRRTPAWLGQAAAIAAAAGFVVIAGVLGWRIYAEQEFVLTKSRSFYGVLQVNELLAPYPRIHKYVMYHGVIEHGFQYQLPERKSWATKYYNKDGGVGIAIEDHPQRSVADRQFRIGVVGLGTGTLSAYANEPDYVQAHGKTVDDYLRYYEINPEVVELAEGYFTYLKEAKARGVDLDIFPGDARIVMERQLEHGQAQAFDVLVVDAFSGDAIPMHLLTREAFETYWSHLKPDGILAVHISNRYLDLRPVVGRAAELMGKQAFFVPYDGDNFGGSSSSWVLVTSNEAFLLSQRFQEAYIPTGMNTRKTVLWTDDFSSLFDVLE